MDIYKKIIDDKLKGWNTWNVRSMLSHVLMPHGFAINIGIKEYQEGDFLIETLLGRLEEGNHVQRMLSGVEKVYPEAHSMNGEYTRIKVEWRNVIFCVETCTYNEDIFIKVIPYQNQKKAAVVVASAGILWNKTGSMIKTDYGFCLKNDNVSVRVKAKGHFVEENTIPVSTPYIAASMDANTYFYTGKTRTIDEIQSCLNIKRKNHENKHKKYGSLSDYHQVLEETLAWNVIYDPINNTFKTIVGRTWSSEWGGYVQHCWDMFFNALSYSIIDKDFAYNSIIEVLQDITDEGFIPNCAAATGFVTLDRSQPPVGSLIIYLIYDKYKDTWLLDKVFNQLLQWNNWYFNSRHIKEGILGWGSTPFEPKLDNYWESAGVGKFYGAAMESGLDNSPMYDNVELDEKTKIMKLGDVGLTSLFIADTKSLIKIAEALNKRDEIDMLKKDWKCVE